MGLRFNISLLPTLLPGEKVLFVKKWVWTVSGKSFPNYRYALTIPPLMENGVYVTDRRVLCIMHICRLLSQEMSQWFEGKAPSGDRDIIQEINVGRGWVFGPYLEVVSLDPTRRWIWSPRVQMRFYMRNPEYVLNIIEEAMIRVHSNDEM